MNLVSEDVEGEFLGLAKDLGFKRARYPYRYQEPDIIVASLFLYLRKNVYRYKSIWNQSWI
jgi:hypothetical protein